MIFILSQSTQPIENTLTSIGGIIIATTWLMQYVKVLVGDTPYLKKVPTFVYVLIVSLMLTFVANRMLHTLNGNLKQLMCSTASAALAASGFYQWMKDGLSGIERAHPIFKRKHPECNTKCKDDDYVLHLTITPADLNWPR